MKYRSRPRRQRVVLRGKQRVVLKRQVKRVFVGGLAVGLAVAFGAEILSSSNAWAPRYIRQHTPVLQVQAPVTLADLPIAKEPQPVSFMLWFPGAEVRLRRAWLRDYPAVRDVHFDKHFLDNRVIARLEPRVPLARWEGRVLDKDGVIFTPPSEMGLTLPKATFAVASEPALPALAQWMSEVSRHADLWSQVVAVSQDLRGEMWLDMQTGTRVAWGAPDIRKAQDKAKSLATVLDDAHRRLSGASSADLRFFDEGRIIVRPKSAV